MKKAGRRRKKPAGKSMRKKAQFSKLIFIGTTAVTLIVTAFSLVMMWRTGDISPLAYLIPAVFAETATATGFYYRKAEKENTKGGIVYDTAMAQMGQRAEEQPPDTPT